MISQKNCNRSGVIKQITFFDKKKSICNKCNSTKVKCEYWTSLLSLSGLKGHIKNSHKEINLPRGVYSVNVLESFSKIKPVNEFIKSNAIDGEAWTKSHKSNEPEYHKCCRIVSKLIAKGVDIDKLLEE